MALLADTNRDKGFLSVAYFASRPITPATKTCFRQRSKSCNAIVAKCLECGLRTLRFVPNFAAPPRRTRTSLQFP
jgi:hypothetical protein